MFTVDSETMPAARERILRAAKAMFASQGYEYTSTIAIARAAGTSETQILKKFGSKEGLLESILDEAWGRMVTAMQQIDPSARAVDRLRLLLGVLLQQLDSDPELKKLIVLDYGHVRRRRSHEVLLIQGHAKLAAMIDEAIAQMHQAGQLRMDVRPQTMRAALLGIISRLLREQSLSSSPTDAVPYATDQIVAFLGILLCCMSPPR